MKKTLSLILALALSQALVVPVSAVGTTITITDEQVGNVTSITNVVGKVTRTYPHDTNEPQNYTIYIVSDEGCTLDIVAAPGVPYAENWGDRWDYEEEYAGYTHMSNDWSVEESIFYGWTGDNFELAKPIHEEFGPYTEKELELDDFFGGFSMSEPSLHLTGQITWMYESAFNQIVSVDGLKGLTDAERITNKNQPITPPAVTVENIPASGTAKASTQAVEVDGKKVEFQMYALLDANGNSTNYVKLRDLAHVLNGTAAQFAVGYSNAAGITLTSGQPYQDNGSEMKTPFSGDRAYTGGGQSVQVNGQSVTMTAINLLDDAGGGYNYFKLRDLGTALGFKVDWSAARGIYIETK